MQLQNTCSCINYVSWLSLLIEEIQISLKVELCRANEGHIRNQRPRLRRNTLILVDKRGGLWNSTNPFSISEYVFWLFFSPAPQKISIHYSYHTKTESHAFYLTATDEALLRGAEDQRIRKKIKPAYLANISKLANEECVSPSRQVRVLVHLPNPSVSSTSEPRHKLHLAWVGGWSSVHGIWHECGVCGIGMRMMLAGLGGPGLELLLRLGLWLSVERQDDAGGLSGARPGPGEDEGRRVRVPRVLARRRGHVRRLRGRRARLPEHVRVPEHRAHHALRAALQQALHRAPRAVRSRSHSRLHRSIANWARIDRGSIADRSSTVHAQLHSAPLNSLLWWYEYEYEYEYMVSSLHDVLSCEFANCKQLVSSLDIAHLVMQTLIDKELISVYGMHEERELHHLKKQWANPMHMFKPQPLDEVKRYFGPTICIYFAWLGTSCSSALLNCIYWIVRVVLFHLCVLVVPVSINIVIDCVQTTEYTCILVLGALRLHRAITSPCAQSPSCQQDKQSVCSELLSSRAAHRVETLIARDQDSRWNANAPPHYQRSIYYSILVSQSETEEANGERLHVTVVWLCAGHYTRALLLPTALGLALWLLSALGELGAGTPRLALAFVLCALCTLVWSTVYIEHWKRYSSTLTFTWGALDPPPDYLAPTRPQYCVCHPRLCCIPAVCRGEASEIFNSFLTRACISGRITLFKWVTLLLFLPWPCTCAYNTTYVDLYGSICVCSSSSCYWYN